MRKFICAILLSGCIALCNGQVNLQSGGVQQSIPLFSYNDPANRVGTGITLNYVSKNGLKVADIPSAVGAGWDLQCGGSIERIQHGEPDDQKNYENYVYPYSLDDNQDRTDFHLWATSHYDNGFLYFDALSTAPVHNSFAYRPYRESGAWPYQPDPLATVDREIDMFTFNFNGRSGTFIIGKKDQNGISEIRTLEDSKLKISKLDGDLNNTNNIRTTISEFQIIDESGIKYKFKDAELTRVGKYNKKYYHNENGTFTGSVGDYPGYSGSTEGTSTIYVDGISNLFTVVRPQLQNSYVKNKWMLSEIENPLTGKKILFEYEDYTYEIDGNKNVEKTFTDNTWLTTITVSKLAGVAKRLKKVTLSPVETVEFEYSNEFRKDISTDKRLISINIKYDNTVKTKWEFTQGYFVKKSILPVNQNLSAEEKVWARLCLLGIKNKGTGSINDPGYSFSYYIENEVTRDSGVPPLFTFSQDYWGYYNPGAGIGFYNPATNGASWAEPLYEPYGGNMMPKFMYTALLTTDRQYNFTMRQPTIEARNGILKSITYPLGGSLTYEYEQNYFELLAAGAITELKGSGGVRVKKTIEYDGINHANDIITTYKYVMPNGTSSAWGYEDIIFKESESYRAYKRCQELKFPAIDIGEIAVGFHNYWTGFKASTIQRSMDTPFQKLIQSTTTQIAISIIVRIIADALQPAYVDKTAETYYSYALNFNNALPYQYSRVEVKKESPGITMGKTVFEFTSPTETNPAFAIDFPTQSLPFSSKQRYAYWLYGHPKSETAYEYVNGQERLSTKIEMEYNPIKYTLNNNLFVSQKWKASKMTYNCDFTLFNMWQDASDIINDIYYPICGRIELKKMFKTIYKPTGESTTTTVEYSYSPDNYQLNKETTTNSAGEVIEAFTYYPLDYSIPGAIQSLKANNILNVGIATQTMITKPGNQKYVLSGSFKEFGTAPNGDIKTINTYAFTSKLPVNSTLVAFNPAQLNPNSNYYQLSGSLVYGNTGQTVQMTSNNRKISTIYDYNDNLPIANIADADITEVAYSSFETDATGGWQVAGGATIHNNSAMTGKRSISGTLSKSSLPTGNYTVTLWTTSNTANMVNSQTGNLLATVGNWKLYEWKLNNVSSVQVSAINADEIRLYPTGASMLTMTYEPLVGKTSECDGNNHLTYYEYDAAGRIRSVKDENRNTIKTFQYNYKQ